MTDQVINKEQEEIDALLYTFSTEGFSYLVEEWSQTIEQLKEQLIYCVEEKEADQIRGYISALRHVSAYETTLRTLIAQEEEDKLFEDIDE